MDLEIRTDTELSVAHVQAHSEAAAAVVDAFVLPRMAVLDSGRIIIPLDDLPEMMVAAFDLSVATIDVTDKRAR